MRKYILLSIIILLISGVFAQPVPTIIYNPNTYDLLDYAVRIDLSNVILGKPVYLKVTDAQGNLLLYCYEQPNGECTNTTPTKIIWVRLNLPPMSNTTIYIYESGVNYAVDGSKVFEFYDDFDSLDSNIWYTHGGVTIANGKVAISPGNYYIRTANGYFNANTMFILLSKKSFDAYHEQGITKLGDYFYISTVDTVNYRGYIYKVDANTMQVVSYVDVTFDNSRYHVGGISRDPSGEFMWTAVAQATATVSAPSVILKVYPNLSYEVAFEVNDHIGAVCTDGKYLYLFNWDAQTLYVYYYNGTLVTTKSRTEGGWGAINDCAVVHGKIYGAAQGENKIYVIDTSTLSTVDTIALPSLGVSLTDEGLDIDAKDTLIFYLLPDNGYVYTARISKNSAGWLVEYYLFQAGNTRRNIGFSTSFPCADSYQNHAIEHSHDKIFEGEVLSSSASAAYRETAGSVSSSDYELHQLIYTADSLILKNLNTSRVIEITRAEAGSKFPSSTTFMYLGAQTWGSATAALYLDWIRVRKYADQAPQVLEVNFNYYNSTVKYAQSTKSSYDLQFTYSYVIPIKLLSNYEAGVNNITIPLTINTQDLISQGILKSDCSDIAVSVYDPTNDIEIQVPFWLDPVTCNTPNTVLYVKIPDYMIGKDNIVFVYLGSPSAVPLVSGDAFYWFVNFATPSEYNKIDIYTTGTASYNITSEGITITIGTDGKLVIYNK